MAEPAADPVGVWPAGLERSYWNLHKLEALGQNDVRGLPFFLADFDLDSGFLIATMIGIVVIVVFANERFRRHSFQPDSFSYSVLRELSPVDLRAHGEMRVARALYIAMLLAIYLVLTFFGKLFFDISQIVTSAGVQSPLPQVNFNGPEWPLMVSFGMAGLVPALKPVDFAENKLRQWAHKAIGIPVEVERKAMRFERLLAEYVETDPDHNSVAIETRAPPWLVSHVTDRETVIRTMRARDQLANLLIWLEEERAYWPNAEVRTALQSFARTQISDAEVILEDFDELLGQSYEHAPDSQTEAGQRLSEQDRLLLHRKRLERHWISLREGINRLRDELCAIIVVYAERDREFSNIHDRKLEAIVTQAFRGSAIQEGPGFWIGMAMFPVFLTYAACVYVGLHPLIGSADTTLRTVTYTALFETARVAALFWFPVAAATTLRHFHRDRDRWLPIRIGDLDRIMTQQLLMAIGLGLLVSCILLVPLHALWAALNSDSEKMFLQKFISDDFNFLELATTLFWVSAVQVTFVVLAIDHKRFRDLETRRPLILFGLASALITLAFYSAYAYGWLGVGYELGWFGPPGSVNQSDDLSNLLSFKVINRYSLVHAVVFSVMAFLSATYFIPRKIGDDAIPVYGNVKQANFWRPSPTAAATTGFAIFIVAAGAISAEAQTLDEIKSSAGTPRQAEGKSPDLPEEVFVGFRTDAEPFSYRVRNAGIERYTGFIADLCHKIFANDRYTLVSKRLDAGSKRFERLRRLNERDVPGKLDVICDPVTLRYSIDTYKMPSKPGRTDGIFSPIVFASGVSYAYRDNGNKSGPIFMTYLDGGTAEEVAIDACRADLFRANWAFERTTCKKPPANGAGQPAGRTSESPSEKNFAQHTWMTLDECKQAEADFAKPKPSRPVGDGEPDNPRKYHFCRADDHSEMVEWFCAETGADATTTQVYLGDIDIITGKLVAHVTDKRCPDYQLAGETYTYEPYALVITASKPELVQFVHQRVYEFFSDSSGAAALFHNHFPDRQMSRPLASLFLLNAVERPGLFRRGQRPAPKPDGARKEVPSVGDQDVPTVLGPDVPQKTLPAPAKVTKPLVE